MKKYILAISLIGATLSLSSCDKFLDIQPVGRVMPTSTQDYRELLTRAYNMGFGDKGLTELRTDAAVIRNDQSDLSLYDDIQKWDDNSTRPATQPLGWAEYYSAIYYANAVIANAGSMTGGTEDDRRQLAGEAYMLRALLHFNLVNLYGQPYTKAGAPESTAVPLKRDLDLEGIPTRATVSALYESVLSDIQEARGLINRATWADGQKYRFNAASVDALEARVFLYQGRWAEALAASERVLTANNALEDLRADGATLPNRYTSKEMLCAFELIVNTSLGRAIKATPQLYAQYDDADRRKALFFGERSTQGDYYDIRKTDGSTQYRSSFRTAEFYLTSAEAAAQTDNLSLARQRLLALQEMRYDASAYAAKQTAVATMTKEQLLEEILSERKKELIFEGHYWFDLRRTSRPAIAKVINGATYNLASDDARYTLRIPQEAIESNPNLIQQ